MGIILKKAPGNLRMAPHLSLLKGESVHAYSARLCFRLDSHAPSNYKKQASWASPGKTREGAKGIFCCDCNLQIIFHLLEPQIKRAMVMSECTPTGLDHSFLVLLSQSELHFIYQEVRETGAAWKKFGPRDKTPGLSLDHPFFFYFFTAGWLCTKTIHHRSPVPYLGDAQKS